MQVCDGEMKARVTEDRNITQALRGSVGSQAWTHRVSHRMQAALDTEWMR